MDEQSTAVIAALKELREDINELPGDRSGQISSIDVDYLFGMRIHDLGGMPEHTCDVWCEYYRIKESAVDDNAPVPF